MSYLRHRALQQDHNRNVYKRSNSSVSTTVVNLEDSKPSNMTFTVLTEQNISQILSNLPPSQLSGFVQALEKALIDYSCQDGATYQCERGVVTRPDGQTSLFMPATTSDLIGTKIVGVRPSTKPPILDRNQIPQPALKSVLTLCDAQGQAIGVLNAAGLTAFRTSLGSMLLFRYRKNVENIVVFGAGQQALWHVRLAILLRGDDIRKVTIVNRSTERTRNMIADLSEPGMRRPDHITITAFNDSPDRDANLETLLVESDAIFCTTPSTEPLFPASYLTSPEAQKKPRYISAIGSYKLNMQEIDPKLLQELTDPASSLPFPTYKGGVVTVDSVDGCLHEAGELVRAGVSVDRMLEVGRILAEKSGNGEGDLTTWLENGFVVYKSVGVGVMDLAIGQHLLQVAEAQGIGLRLDEF